MCVLTEICMKKALDCELNKKLIKKNVIMKLREDIFLVIKKEN